MPRESGDESCRNEPSVDRDPLDLILQMAFGGPANEGPTGDRPPAETTGELLETVLGNYKLREQIAGQTRFPVYVADRLSQPRCRVALRMGDRDMVVASDGLQLQTYRTSITNLKHPNIASVVDLRGTAEGRPFVVYELVLGKPIVEFCDQREIDVVGRVKLFRVVCDAVRYAHAQEVVHGWIGPSRVMVGYDIESPVVKVVDIAADWMWGDDPTGWRPNGPRRDVQALCALFVELLAGIQSPLLEEPPTRGLASPDGSSPRQSASNAYRALDVKHQTYIANTRATTPAELLDQLLELERIVSPSDSIATLDELMQSLDSWLWNHGERGSKVLRTRTTRRIWTMALCLLIAVGLAFGFTRAFGVW